jgi:glutamine synthetase
MLSTSLESATKMMMRPGSIAREVLGDGFVEHFGGTRQHEVKLWNEAVTNWEGKILCHSGLQHSDVSFSGTIS